MQVALYVQGNPFNSFSINSTPWSRLTDPFPSPFLVRSVQCDVVTQQAPQPDGWSRNPLKTGISIIRIHAYAISK
jgi:hypothetical protein